MKHFIRSVFILLLIVPSMLAQPGYVPTKENLQNRE
jgi:hypothetical protein